MKRRQFMAGAGAALLASANRSALAASVADIPIIDTHIHLFDARRPQGAPYVGNPVFRNGVSLPGMYREFAATLGIVGAIETEASPWIEDNLWVLEVMQPEPIMVGTVGDLQPEKPEFAEYLDRYHKNPLFRGIRYGNIWTYNLVRQADNPVFIEGLKRLAQADLVLDVANPAIDLLQATVKIADKVPELRIVIDHLPGFDPKPEEMAPYEAVLKEIAPRKRIFVKLSSVNHKVNGVYVAGLKAHGARLDHLMDVFGEDRVMFTLGWPGTGDTTLMSNQLEMLREYFGKRGRGPAEKFFWKNSAACYKWIKRAPNQPSLT